MIAIITTPAVWYLVHDCIDFAANWETGAAVWEWSGATLSSNLIIIYNQWVIIYLHIEWMSSLSCLSNYDSDKFDHHILRATHHHTACMHDCIQMWLIIAIMSTYMSLSYNHIIALQHWIVIIIIVLSYRVMLRQVLVAMHWFIFICFTFLLFYSMKYKIVTER